MPNAEVRGYRGRSHPQMSVHCAVSHSRTVLILVANCATRYDAPRYHARACMLRRAMGCAGQHRSSLGYNEQSLCVSVYDAVVASQQCQKTGSYWHAKLSRRMHHWVTLSNPALLHQPHQRTLAR